MWLISLSFESIDLMFKHQLELEYWVCLLYRSYNSFEDPIFLRLRHESQEFVETVRWKDLPVALRELQELRKDKLDRLFLIFKWEVELLLETNVLVASPESDECFKLGVNILWAFFCS